MKDTYATHHAETTVNAPVHQVYNLFSHFNDFPKFMSFVKEVTYYDNQNSHWVADVLGQQEWDATNDQWIPDRQIGWRSTKGLDNFGKVTFEPVGLGETKVDVFVNYNPPAGVLGDIGEKLGAGSHFDHILQNDLNHFANMVDQAPPGALDPNSSNYLFHQQSAAAKGTTTSRQDDTMRQQQAGSAQCATGPQQADSSQCATGPQHADSAQRATRPQHAETIQQQPAEPARGATRPQQNDVVQPRRSAATDEYQQVPDELLYQQPNRPEDVRYPPQI